MTERPRIYTRFVIRQLLPAPEWQGVYIGDDGAHFLMPIAALALVYRHDYDAHTGQRVDTSFHDDDPEESWEIVGVDYSVDMSFSICDEAANFCGLLPPGMALATFEERAVCQRRHRRDLDTSPGTP